MSSLLVFISSLLFQLYAAEPLAERAQTTYIAAPGPATYDYVVVGAGAAGLTIAARLAENPRLTVAVVEAGDFAENSSPANISKVPGYGFGVSTPSLDWGFKTVPQSGANDRQLAYSRGKAVGGSTVTNLMAYHRGTVDAYDRWAAIAGDDGFKFSNFLKYFTRGVHYTPPNQSLRAANGSVPPLNTSAYSKTGGPLDITYSNYADAIDSYAAAAWSELGVSTLPDLLSGKLIGNQYSPLTVYPKDQTRATSRFSYLRYAVDSGRDNLKLYKQSLAKRVVFDSNKRATGVVVNSTGQLYTLTARKEVIVSAGTLQTPQLLMVSGVGPRATLTALGIPVIANLPGVGANMQDHLFVSTVYKVNVVTESQLLDPSFAAAASRQFNQKAAGILTSNGAAYFGWEKIRDTSHAANFTASTNQSLKAFPADWPDYEMVIGDLPVASDANYAQGIVMLQTALSRGSISISSNNTSDPPLIDTQTLVHPSDQQVMVQAVKRTRAFFNTKSARRVVLEEIAPGPGVRTDEELLSFLQTNAGPGFHGACSCAMGKSSDPNAVVDAQGRVYGTRSLRVVDASIFPILPPGHLLLTVYALAEKVAEHMR